MEWSWTATDARCGSTIMDAKADSDGDVEIQYDAPSGIGYVYVPIEVLAEVLRRSGYTVTKP